MEQAGPKTGRFTYVRIPAEDGVDVEEVIFDGNSDEQFRDSIRQYFRSRSLSDGQKEEYKRSLAQKAEEKGAKAQESTLASVADDSTFEIVPVVLPSNNNGFIGTSLYIDDVGRFKDLPINSRASKIAQKDIRGDAFLCSNHDDPSADDWERVDCNTNHFFALTANPQQGALDTSNQAQMQAAGMMRDAETKLVTEEEATAALKSKADGNEAYKNGDIDTAISFYTAALNLTEARIDKLDNSEEVAAMRLTTMSNRAMCLIKTGQFRAAQDDCVMALRQPKIPEAQVTKIMYRLALALEGRQEYDSALEVVEKFESNGGPAEEAANLRASITAKKRAQTASEKKVYGKMFG